VLGCVTQCSQSAGHSYEQFLQVQQIGFVTLLLWSGPGGIRALSARPTSFLQCFDTVGLVI